MTDRFLKNPMTLEQRVLSEQVVLMNRLSKSPLIGSVMIAAIVTYLAAADAGLAVSLSWYAAALAITGARLLAGHIYLRRPRTPEEVHRWLPWHLTLIVLFGMTWSIPGAFLMPSDPERETIMSVMFIGATAAGIGSLSTVRHAYTLLLVPFTLPYGVHQFLIGGDRLLIGIAFLLYIPVMLVIAYRQAATVERQIRLAIENEALINELTAERDRANEANRELQVQMEHQRRSAERIRSLNRDLQTRAVELHAANSDLEGFCYSISHDLRAPLRAIDGFTHLLEVRAPADTSNHSLHYLKRIRANIARMARLIDDLLEFSRCGKQPIEKTELEMTELARNASLEACAAHPMRVPPKITIESLPAAQGDHVLIHQVWVNLIDNAVKYSSKVRSPHIIVRGREEPDRTVYEIIDNGAGFDSRYSGALFGVFQRLHASHEFPGSGVGLAIVQRIVSRHGGHVWANGEVDRGATFGFALPKADVIATTVLQEVANR